MFISEIDDWLNDASSFDKILVYMNYWIDNMSTHIFYDISKDTLRIKSSEEFLDRSIFRDDIHNVNYSNKCNIHITDIGENWNKLNYAQRYQTRYDGIYDYLYKNKLDIKSLYL